MNTAPSQYHNTDNASSKARGQVVFILALIAAFAMVMGLDRLKILFPDDLTRLNFKSVSLTETAPTELPEPEPLTDIEMEWARTAWSYFNNNMDKKTGLVSSVEGYPSTTMWDTASSMMGFIAAYELGLSSKKDFDWRISATLKSLRDMPLYNGVLPNKAYNVETLQMVDYANNPVSEGVGWSAVDIGRVFVPLNIITWNYPEHTKLVSEVIAKWDLSELLQDGIMVGAARDEEGQTINIQEGRLGYEQYAAKSLNLVGRDVSAALDYGQNMQLRTIGSFEIPVDRRSPERYAAHNYIVSEPFILDGVEFGFDRVSREMAWRVYQAQEERYLTTGQLTAVSEDHLDRAPYFVYNTIFSSGKAWNALTQDGQDASNFRTVSTKTAFGWHALYRTEYTQQLVDSLVNYREQGKGWYAGMYEGDWSPNKALTANTNGVVLESLFYKAKGRLVGLHSRGGGER